MAYSEYPMQHGTDIIAQYNTAGFTDTSIDPVTATFVLQLSIGDGNYCIAFARHGVQLQPRDYGP